jgi:uncharacterized membrane protein
MATQTETRAQIERYLLRLRSALGGMPDAEKAEILSDIRNHIEERLVDAPAGQAEAATETMAALGNPETLAATYRRERLMARAVASPAPALLLHATFQWALTGLRGFLAFLALLIGYSSGLSFLVCAVLKPFLPSHIGLWLDPPLFSIGYFNAADHLKHEVLGWWIVPLGLAIGPLMLIWTTRLVQWLIRRRPTQSKLF